MSGITTAQSIRFATVDDVISSLFLENEARDIDREIGAANTARSTAMNRGINVLTNTSAPTFPVSTATAVTFTTQQVNGALTWNGTTRLTAGAASALGFYYVAGLVLGTAPASWTVLELTTRKNGATLQYRNRRYNAAGFSSTPRPMVGGIVYLGTVGDYMETVIYHEGGGTDAIGSLMMTAIKLSTT